MSEETSTPTTDKNEPEKIDPIEAAIPKPVTPVSGNIFARVWQRYRAHKKVAIPLTILVVIGLIVLIPFSRYKVLGLFMTRQFSVTVVDSQTTRPITSATINFAGHSAITDNTGQAHVKAKVGRARLQVTKKYYISYSQSFLNPLSTHSKPVSIRLVATGRQVPVKIINKITGQPVEDVTIVASDTEARTDKDGAAILVVPTTKPTLAVTLTGSGYNNTSASLQVTDQVVAANTFSIVPLGKVYFLSKASGKIDVVKTNLDGGDRQTVLAGTGTEDDSNTVLLASRDWKFLALLSRRDSSGTKVYLIDTSTDKLTTIDEGAATFNASGWQNHNFIYTVNRSNVSNWQPKQEALKSFNADNGQITLLDETTAEGTSQYDYANQSFTDVYVLPSVIVYTVSWNSSFYSANRLNDKQAAIVSIHADKSQKSTLLSLGVPSGTQTGTVSFNSRLDTAQTIYFQFSLNNSFYKYDSGKVASTSEVDQNTYYSDIYNTYLASPSGKQTFWYEQRDGKDTLLVGDSNGSGAQTIASLAEYTPFGWYGDSYLLLSKNSSELYIIANAPLGSRQPLKITDYHKPAVSFTGYGGGYGGL